MHGLEKVAVAMVLRLLDVLYDGFGVDQRITSMLEKVHVWLVPVLNPDGYVTSTRKNARGVDLNRNFGVSFADKGLAKTEWWPFYGGP